MHPKKKTIIKELISNIEGKKPEECLPHLIKANASLRNMNMTFSSEESANIFLLLTDGMPEGKKNQLKSLLKMF